MNIAVFTNNYLPNPYGVTVSIESFRKELEKRGHTVFIFAPNWKGHISDVPNVYRYSSIDIAYKFRFPLPIPVSIHAERVLKKLQIDIVHAHHPNLLGKAARRWARKKGVPLVFTWHTLYDKYVHFSPPLIPEKKATQLVIRNAVKYANRCDQVIVPTGSVRKIIRNWGVTNSHIIDAPTGIEEKKYAHSDPERIRKQFHIQEGEKLILTVSRLTQEKNLDFLARSLFPFLRSRKDLKFMIGGEGYMLDELKSMAKEHAVEDQVIFPGLIPNEELKDYLAASDIFVYASTSETQGLVIAEAMYMGVPVVAVRAPGVQDMVMDKVTGVLVGEELDDFSSAVEGLLSDDEQRERYSQKALEIAKNTLTSSVCTDRLIDIYEDVIERKRSSNK